MNRLRLLFFILVTTLIIPATAAAFELQGIHINAGKTFILNAEPIEVSPAPLPVVSTAGVSVPMKFNSILYFEPGLRFYGTNVILSAENKAVPAAEETKNRVFVLNCELRPEIGALFELGESISLGVTGAPQFTFRVPVKGFDDAETGEHKTTVRDYYFSRARFLGIYAGGLFSWNINENTAFRLKAGTNLPIYHIWDGDDSGFHDQLSIAAELGIVFRF